MKAICLGSLIQGQLSGWQLFGGKNEWSIILWGNNLNTNCPGANYLGKITGEATFFWGGVGNYPEGHHPGCKCPGGNFPRGNCLGRNYLGDNSHVPLIKLGNLRKKLW